MNKFEKITEARILLELPETATLDTIRSNFRRILARWHPDKGAADKETCHDMTIKIVAAYKTITEYCLHYQYSFSEESVKNHLSPEEWWADRFGEDPLWGRGAGSK